MQDFPIGGAEMSSLPVGGRPPRHLYRGWRRNYLTSNKKKKVLTSHRRPTREHNRGPRPLPLPRSAYVKHNDVIVHFYMVFPGTAERFEKYVCVLGGGCVCVNVCVFECYGGGGTYGNF